MWENTIEVAHALKMPYEQGRAHLELAHTFKNGDLRRERHTKKAIELLQPTRSVQINSAPHGSLDPLVVRVF